MLERFEKPRVVGFIDMVLIPESGFSDAFAIRIMTQPAFRRRVQRIFSVVAQQCDDVALDVCSLAVGAGLIANRKPEERHFANDFAHLSLQYDLAFSYLGLRVAPLAPGREAQFIASDESRSHDQSEDGAPVIATATGLSPVLGKARPEFCA
jgi:hypothetical protein